VTTAELKKKNAKKSSARRFADAPPGKDQTNLKAPDGFEFFKSKEKVGTVKLDFVPYRVKSNSQRHADVGDLHFEREYLVHRVPTAGGSDSYVCAKDAFGTKCAVCDYLMKNQSTIEPELAKSLKAQVRNLYLVIEDLGNPKAKPKIFDQPYYGANKNGFGQQMRRLIDTLDEDQDPFDLEEGSTLVLSIEEDTFNGNKWYPVTRIDIRPRKTQYSEKLVDLYPCLDEVLIEPDYNSVLGLLTTGVAPDDKDEEPKKETKRSSEKPAAPKVEKAVTPDSDLEDSSLDSDVDDPKDSDLSSDVDSDLDSDLDE
jgi:hypothetical protein